MKHSQIEKLHLNGNYHGIKFMELNFFLKKKTKANIETRMATGARQSSRNMDLHRDPNKTLHELKTW